MPIKILFICHGNICRSPMAEFVMKNMVKERGLEDELLIESAAISDEECWNGIGNPIYPPAKAELMRHGIGVPGNELGVSEKRARQIRRSDYDKWDYLIGMESHHINGMKRILGNDPEGKICLLMDFTAHPENINDPWYSGDFEGVYRQISEGCECLLYKLSGSSADK